MKSPLKTILTEAEEVAFRVHLEHQKGNLTDVETDRKALFRAIKKLRRHYQKESQ